jgi:hypothetical protein
MPMMRIRIVRMLVSERIVSVGVRMLAVGSRHRCRIIMFVLMVLVMVFVMGMLMVVLQRFMRMFMTVMFGQMQPDAEGHQNAGNDQLRGECFAQ